MFSFNHYRGRSSCSGKSHRSCRVWPQDHWHTAHSCQASSWLCCCFLVPVLVQVSGQVREKKRWTESIQTRQGHFTEDRVEGVWPKTLLGWFSSWGTTQWRQAAASSLSVSSELTGAVEDTESDCSHTSRSCCRAHTPHYKCSERNRKLKQCVLQNSVMLMLRRTVLMRRFTRWFKTLFISGFISFLTFDNARKQDDVASETSPFPAPFLKP